MRRFEKIPWKERKTQKSENPEISSVWEEIQDLNGDIKRWLKYYLSATALFEELLKKSVKSILGRYLCGRNNPKITHRFLCECYKINNYNLGMWHDENESCKNSNSGILQLFL